MPTADVMRVLLARLIDDAGLFPPARLPMPDALAANRWVAADEHAGLVGRFLVPVSRLEEFAGVAGASAPELGVVVDTLGLEPDAASIDAVATCVEKYQPSSIEVLASGGPAGTLGRVLDGFSALPDQTALYVELPPFDFHDDWRGAIETLGAARANRRNVGAKVRCARTASDHALTEDELARFVVACRQSGTPFKATAGLHHAIRHTQDDGLERHGFLNVLLACAVALRGSPDDAVASVLAERSADVVLGGVESLTVEDAFRVRTELLAGFGCCNPAEPIDDLHTLGLLGPLGLIEGI
ncbi:MAG: hypothetical protein ABI912_12555 [Actinomycetota bacterium]